ncbi:GNAT family N-acetyltransferase [Pseudoxanthomonas sp. LjRoot125]|uniref:GNAT family N-acetyltransferase n=1 Tax=Pseudoxanthomonas sp. LjRoot125 TaxID=3342258 RepID=UPI003E115F3E
MTAPLLAEGSMCLRPLDARDEDLYLRLHASAQTMRHVSAVVDADTARSRFSAACRMTQSPDPAYWMWAVSMTDPADDAGIALLMADGTSAEIGMLLLPEWQGRGLGTCAVRTLTDYGFNTLGVARVESRQGAHNVGWERLMERSGFQRVEEAMVRPDWLRWRRERG